MASKYAGLKGKVPEAPTERSQEITEHILKRAGQSFTDLAGDYNNLRGKIDGISAALKVLNTELDAIEIMLRESLEAQNADSVKTQGYTWSSNPEPYPSCENPEAIIAYFNDNGMADQLKLRSTELASRLKGFVKEEALANELIPSVKIVDGPDGEPIETLEVRSKIPGVKVFLKYSLSRVKSSRS